MTVWQNWLQKASNSWQLFIKKSRRNKKAGKRLSCLLFSAEKAECAADMEAAVVPFVRVVYDNAVQVSLQTTGIDDFNSFGLDDYVLVSLLPIQGEV